MLINKKLTTAIAAGAILMNAIVPAAFAQGTAAGILGNGAESSNTVNVAQNNNSTATQNNAATITNDVHSNANTGGNNANFNTGGNNMVNTGGATNAVSISNSANSNQLSTGGNNPFGGGSLIQETGNGAFSGNNANVTTNNNNTAAQNNAAAFTNHVDASAKTGNNSGSDNTGGNTSIFTGPAKNAVQVNNEANQNVMMGGAGVLGNGGATELDITGNGALSDNNINDTANNNAVAAQNNEANFANIIKGGASTGKNTGDFNTDGSTAIFTGSALNLTGVSNMANSNVIDALDCGCATTNGDLFKQAENGAFSTNTVNAEMNNNKTAAQNNGAEFSNVVDPHAFTGDNSLSDATGSYFFGGEQGVMTGQAASQTQVSNTSNENVLSTDGMNVGGMQFTWNPGAFMGWFGM